MGVSIATGVSAGGLVNPVFLGTGSATLPSGTTAERPVPPTSGMIRFNTTTGLFEGYNGSSWVAFAAAGAGITAINSQAGPGITFAAGGAGTDFAVTAAANVITYNLPDAGAAARGVVSTGAQTLSGAKTFSSDLRVTSTGAVLLSSGTTAQRPAPTNGMIRYNSDLSVMEAYISGAWTTLSTGSTGVTSVNALTGALSLVTGTAGSDFAVASVGTTITLNLPDAGATARGVLTTGVQVFSGAKTFSSDLTVSSTGFLQLPAGTTGQRPGSPAAGMIRYNTTTSAFESYNGTNWYSIATINSPPQNVIYISVNGNDTTGDGSYYKPYATIGKANAVITTAATGNRYIVYIMQGLYAEATMVMKPWVYYVGMTTVACRVNIASNLITADPSWGSGNGRGGLLNISLVGSTYLSLDFSAMAAASAVVDVYNVNMNGGITFKGRVLDADFLQAQNLNCIGNLSVSNCQGFIINALFGGSSNFDTAFNTGGTTFDVEGLLTTSMTATSTGGASTLVNLTNSRLDGTLTLSGANTTVTADATSIPTEANTVITGGATLTRRTDAYGVAYVPATSSNWPVVPNRVNQALDFLAASVSSTPGALIYSVNIAVPISGGTVNIPNNVAVQVLNPAGTLPTLTVNLPSVGVVNGQVVTITTSQQITSLTLGGATINPAASLPLGGVARYIFLTSTSTWYPL